MHSPGEEFTPADTHAMTWPPWQETWQDLLDLKRPKGDRLWAAETHEISREVFSDILGNFISELPN